MLEHIDGYTSPEAREDQLWWEFHNDLVATFAASGDSGRG